MTIEASPHNPEGIPPQPDTPCTLDITRMPDVTWDRVSSVRTADGGSLSPYPPTDESLDPAIRSDMRMYDTEGLENMPDMLQIKRRKKRPPTN